MNNSSKRISFLKIINFDILENGNFRDWYGKRCGTTILSRPSSTKTLIPCHERWAYFNFGRYQLSFRIWKKSSVDGIK